MNWCCQSAVKWSLNYILPQAQTWHKQARVFITHLELILLELFSTLSVLHLSRHFTLNARHFTLIVNCQVERIAANRKRIAHRKQSKAFLQSTHWKLAYSGAKMTRKKSSASKQMGSFALTHFYFHNYSKKKWCRWKIFVIVRKTEWSLFVFCCEYRFHLLHFFALHLNWTHYDNFYFSVFIFSIKTKSTRKKTQTI